MKFLLGRRAMFALAFASFAMGTIKPTAGKNNKKNREYFVSPNGSDDNPGTQAAPFKTIQRAADIMVGGDICYIRAGIYRETVKPIHSGHADAPITFQAFSGERVIVSGTELVSGSWKQHKGNIYTIQMPWTLGLGKDMVFVNGIPVIQARHPNRHTSSSGRQLPPIELSPLWMTFGDFSVALNSSDISNPTDLGQNPKDYWKGALYVGWHGWGWCLQSAKVISSRPGVISVNGKTRRWWFPGKKFAENFKWFQQGYLTNHLNALDQSGEWHWQQNRLYLWSPDNKNPSGHIVEAKKRHLAFDLRNRDHIVIKDLRIFASSVNLYNANHCLIDGCRMSFVSHYTKFDDARDGYIDNYRVRNSDGAPQRGEVGVYIGGKNNVIQNSVIKHSAGAGLILGGYRTTVTNSIIHDCGYVGTYLGAIFITYDPAAKREELRGGHTITHNEIYRSGRTLIAVSSDFNRYPKEQTVYEAMEISYNQLHDGAITANDAGGAFYTWGTTLGSKQSRTQIHHNLIWNVWGYFWNALIYPDARVDGLDIHHNVLWQSPLARKQQVKKGNQFYKTNSPGDSTYADSNIEKPVHDSGVAGLMSSDFPGGYFVTGPTIVDEKDSWY